jgi:hypothetical protein
MRILFLLVVGTLTISTNAQYGYGAVEVPDGFSPRYYLGAFPELARRQSGDCGTDEHSCMTIHSLP